MAETSHIKIITDEIFIDTIKSAGKPVLVDFYADWCGPCKMAAPVLEKLAEEYQGKVDFFKINIDDNQQIPAEYGVMSVPTVMIAKYDDDQVKVLSDVAGFVGETAYRDMLDAAIKDTA